MIVFCFYLQSMHHEHSNFFGIGVVTLKQPGRSTDSYMTYYPEKTIYLNISYNLKTNKTKKYFEKENMEMYG